MRPFNGFGPTCCTPQSRTANPPQLRVSGMSLLHRLARITSHTTFTYRPSHILPLCLLDLPVVHTQLVLGSRVVTLTMPAVTRSLRSSTRLTTAPVADEKKPSPAEPKPTSKTEKKTKKQAPQSPPPPKPTAGQKRKAAASIGKEEETKAEAVEDEDEPKPKPAKKAKVS